MTPSKSPSTIDYLLVTLVGAYTFFGLLLLASASEGNITMVVKQSFHVVLALSIAFYINTYSNHQIQRYAFYLYFFAIGLLLVVLMFGHVGKGAQRWLDLKFIRFDRKFFD